MSLTAIRVDDICEKPKGTIASSEQYEQIE